MWRIVFLLAALLSCKTTTEKQEAKTENFTKEFILKQLLNANRQLDSISYENVELRDKISNSKANNYAMMEGVLNSKEAVVEVKFLKAKLNDALIEKDAILKQDIELRKRNEQLVKENEGYKYKLNNEIEQHGATKKQKIKLEKEISYASSLNLASIRVMGVGYTLAILGKPKAIETNVAKKVKSVLVSFTMPANMLAAKEEKKVVVVMYSTDSKEDIRKDTTINYIGNECNVSLYLKSKKEFSVGTHLINIVINSKLEAEREFNITK